MGEVRNLKPAHSLNQDCLMSGEATVAGHLVNQAGRLQIVHGLDCMGPALLATRALAAGCTHHNSRVSTCGQPSYEIERSVFHSNKSAEGLIEILTLNPEP